MYDLSSDINNTPKTNTPGKKGQSWTWHVKYYRLWFEVIPSENDYSIMYKGTTKII